MKPCTRELHTTKKYKKNRLKKRIARVMRFSNTISAVFLIVAMTLVIGGLMSFMGKGYTQYVAEQIALDVQESYDSLQDKSDFESIIVMDEEAEAMMEVEMKMTVEDLSEEELEQMKEMWEQFEEVRGVHRMDEDITLIKGFTFFEYSIHYNGAIIFDSYNDGRDTNSVDELMQSNQMHDKIFNESAAPFVNEDGKPIGKVTVQVSPDLIGMVYLVSIGLAIIIFLINTLITKILTSITSKMVSRPLETLAVQMEDLSNEDLENAFNVVIDIKRPISEVKSLTDSTSKIMQKMAHYYELMTAQNEELEAQRDELESQRDELEAQTEELEAQRDELESQNDQLVQTGSTLQSMNNAYLSRTLKLQNLLDNVGQGFMTVGSDLLVNSEYSLACTDMVCEIGCDDGETHSGPHTHDITGKKVTELLFQDDSQREFIEDLLVKIIEGADHERNLFIPLLPEEIEMNGRIQSIDYKIVKNEHFQEQMMIIMTDITLTRELEQQMSVERDVLQMIVKVLLNRDDFLSTLEEMNVYLDTDTAEMTQDQYEDALRTIHTFKGSFGQYYMNATSAYLNELEDYIYENGTIDAIKETDSELIRAKITEDLKIVESYVGKDFIYNKDQYTVKEEKIIEIEQKIKRILPATEFNKVIPIIQSIRYKSVKEGLKSYPDYVTKLSERMDKSVVPFEITGPDVFVDFDVYQKVFKSMVHLFRNAVDHGIEDGDTRIENEKQLSAIISCEVVNQGHGFDLIVKDDGRGMSEATLAKIFDDGFTTKEEASAISGRGVGLSALKSEVEALGGRIKVESVEGQSSTFTIKLPLIQGTDVINFEPEVFLKHIQGITGNYFDSMSFEFDKSEIVSTDLITLHKVSALLSMKGSIDGMLILSVSEAFAKDLVKAFVIEDLTEEEMISYAEDVLGEVTNTILGNVLGELEDEGVYLSIGVPVMLTNQSAYMKYTDRQILSANYTKGDYVVSLSLLITESDNYGGQIALDDDIMEILRVEGGRTDG